MKTRLFPALNTSHLRHAFALPVYLMHVCVSFANQQVSCYGNWCVASKTMFTITRRMTPNYSRLIVSDGLLSAPLQQNDRVWWLAVSPIIAEWLCLMACCQPHYSKVIVSDGLLSCPLQQNDRVWWLAVSPITAEWSCLMACCQPHYSKMIAFDGLLSIIL